MRRVELWLLAACAVVLTLAGLAGQSHAPAERRYDPRASTFLAGPNGAKGLAQALRRLGVPVRVSRRPVFDLARDSAPARLAEVYAFLDVYVPPDEEIAVVRDFVDRGGRIFVVGYTGIERCFGYESRYIGTDEWETLEEPIGVAAPEPGWTLPGTRRVMARLSLDSLLARHEGTDESVEPCPFLAPVARSVLLETTDRRPVAVALGFRGGGRAVLIADAALVNNKALKETDAGLLVIPWLVGDALGGRAAPVRRVVVDEFHQGFGAGGTFWHMFAAAWRWLVAQPVGWAVLQLLAVGLVALVVAAARFGPARAVIERRRRSPMEHLEALAAGLERADGAATAVDLIVGGLRRRLGRGGYAPTGGDRGDGREWLAALELALPADRGRRAARRLKWIVTQPGGGDERVLAAAQAVEDVWEELHPRKTRD